MFFVMDLEEAFQPSVASGSIVKSRYLLIGFENRSVGSQLELTIPFHQVPPNMSEEQNLKTIS